MIQKQERWHIAKKVNTFSRRETRRQQYVTASERFQNEESIDKSLTIYRDALAAAGLISFTYHVFPGFGEVEEGAYMRFYSHNFSDEVISTYLSIYKSKFDPTIELVYEFARPLRLSEVVKIQEERGKSSPDIANIAHVAKMTFDRFGEGICIPLFGPHFSRGYTFVTTGEANRELSDAIIWDTHHLASEFHSRYIVLQSKLQRQVRLSNREMEALELVVMGRKNQDIARAMGISIHTVDSYLRRIFLKLGTTDRVTTSIRALQYDLLKPGC